MNPRTLAFLIAGSLPFAAQAGAWHADASNSSLTFTGTQQGESFDGRFKAFDANIVFDPADLAHARFDVKITLASADTANTERDESLRGTDFFDVKHAPLATWRATAVRSLGGGRYAADGALTLRGIAKPVTLTFTWTGGASPSLVGDATVNRLDFNVGGGQWADTSAVGNAVKVHTELKLGPAAPSTWKVGQPREPKPLVRKGG